MTNIGDIVRDNPVDAMMDGWSQKQHDDFRVGTGAIIEPKQEVVFRSALMRREGAAITVRWLDGVHPYCCYHHKEEISLYCPMWELWEL